MRLAIVACTVLITVGVLSLVTLQARRAERALDEAAAHTLRDYTGYAGRMMGGEVLRRFAEQRATILSPVSGSAWRTIAEPSLNEIVERGDRYFAAFPVLGDSRIGYFKIDLRTGALEGRRVMAGAFASRVADTLVKIALRAPITSDPDLLVVDHEGVPYSVAYARLMGSSGQPTAIYGFTYKRAPGIAAVAQRAYRETPLLPTSFAGARWNYDTTRVRPGEVINDSLLGMRITDRSGHVFWQSSRAAEAAVSPYSEQVVVSTSTGGFVVESTLRLSSSSSLIPTVVRRAQRWSMRALLVLTILLAGVSLIALRSERQGARERRADAMRQLALGLRHEINNALASVMLNAELLAGEGTVDPAQREQLEAILEQADRMRGVLRRLEKVENLDVVVPYLDEGFMVDLSAASLPDSRINVGDAVASGETYVV